MHPNAKLLIEILIQVTKSGKFKVIYYYSFTKYRIIVLSIELEIIILLSYEISINNTVSLC